MEISSKKVYNDADTTLNINPFHIIAFTDGSAHPNNKSISSRAGYATCFASGPISNKLIYGNLDISRIYASNIRAEMFAIIRALEYVYEIHITNKLKWNLFTIITDCEFVINLLETFMPNWSDDKIAEKSNPDLTKRIWNIYNKVKKIGCVKFIHVRSHNKNGWKTFKNGTYEKFCYENNEYVDQICGFARSNLKPAEEVIADVVFDT